MLIGACNPMLCPNWGGGAQDYFEFSETIYDYILLVGSCKVAMTQRQEVNKVYLATVQSLDSKKKREAAIKADPKKSALKEKVDAAAQEVKEAEARVKKVHPCPPFTSSNSILGTVPWTQTLSAASPPRLPAGACLRCPCPCHTSCVSYVFSAPSLRRRTRSSDTYLCPPPHEIRTSTFSGQGRPHQDLQAAAAGAREVRLRQGAGVLGALHLVHRVGHDHGAPDLQGMGGLSPGGQGTAGLSAATYG